MRLWRWTPLAGRCRNPKNGSPLDWPASLTLTITAPPVSSIESSTIDHASDVICWAANRLTMRRLIESKRHAIRCIYLYDFIGGCVHRGLLGSAVASLMDEWMKAPSARAFCCQIRHPKILSENAPNDTKVLHRFGETTKKWTLSQQQKVAIKKSYFNEDKWNFNFQKLTKTVINVI